MKPQNIEVIKVKEFLSVQEVATLLSFSIRTTYRLIEKGTIKAVNLSKRKTLVKRSEIDKLFTLSGPIPTPNEKELDPIQYDISDYYTISEIQTKFGISETALRNLIKRKKIPKFKKSRNIYVLKHLIDELLS